MERSSSPISTQLVAAESQTEAMTMQSAASPIPAALESQLQVSTALQKPPPRPSLPARALISPTPTISHPLLPAHHGSRKPKEPLSLQQRFEQSILLDEATACTIAAVANECHAAVDGGGNGLDLDQAELERLLGQIPTGMIDFLANYDVNAVTEGAGGVNSSDGADWFVGHEEDGGLSTATPAEEHYTGDNSKEPTASIVQSTDELPAAMAEVEKIPKWVSRI